ncbi:sigma 54-interacting transcriptional regulator [Aneurinibacillus aneurinilyticus]|jgi:transcriptional regulator with PAS, ATPase and Fis domain|uniref:HTH-type transcriptional regulatory protein TyrR n=1 Tax=Aneurinibacillus aneurinilyticus ATCC 12856 TaxID=649747 RepID=U1X8Y7_ANEAE|nr:sigma 54-interacting transcriptional regulator [Aneurinibacillus aneurinilyticus]ERI11435.1 Sigma-54 interaction domain protein [Aneurinibacillus aneurinilyticus ATCC 12856]MCI1694238.1 sigma 54-interacting transcriptional regulator [Aneurinibacillus aneurinilyticus]MED0707772.1 sigma 54-interacting transcriptional regulator [Aneurinibacillus aneurinilyticus]MED0722437.1 sigma 54-interacting transcriptional regulator [Aneurinibacillus aneurinilyticus]MED0733135.1 sigma 54-interacting transc
MMIWEQILRPISAIIDRRAELQDVLREMHEQGTDIAFVTENGNIVGYVHTDSLLEQLRDIPDLQQPIQYRKDILKVPHLHPVEYYHNISVVLGMNTNGDITGYSTVRQARYQMNELQLTHMNEILNGAGAGVVRTNTDFEIEFINETAENILGLSRSFLINRNYKKLLTINKDINRVIQGETLMSVSSSINFKQISGNFSPLRIDGKVTGLVHIFFLRETFEEAVQELEFVRNLYSDLQAVYASSHEQILVVNPNGEVMRVAGTFLKEFWEMKGPEEVIGGNIYDFENKGMFRPNIVDLCIKKKKKLTMIQDTIRGRKVWSVATPVYHEGKLEKVVVLSRDITETSRLREKTAPTASEQEALEQSMPVSHTDKPLIYRSRVVEDLVDEVKRVARVDSTVLFTGESGVGKEVFARALHAASRRSEQALIRVNCGAIPESLIESELFGYERGAFTGADQKGKPGLFEMAHRGSIFLDEIGELSPNVQVKLLRVLQEKEIVRVGGVHTIPVDVRVIAATNQNLQEMIERGEFREDLYYRLNVIPIRIPPLRERMEDIFSLSIYFLQQFARSYQIEKGFSPEALEVLENYDWPGNVRELQNIVERLLVTSQGEFIQREDVLRVLYGETGRRRKQPMVFELMPLKEAVAELESQLIELGLKKYGTALKVSEALGVSPATISRRMNKRLR